MYRASSPSLYAIAVVTAIASLALAGCGEGVHNSFEDNAFIRVPGVDAPSLAASVPSIRSLMPTRLGSFGRNRITIRTSQGQAADSKGNPFQTLYEKAVCIRAAPVLGGGTNVLIDVQPEKPNNIAQRTELYQVDQKGIFLSRITGDQEYSVRPPVPLILANSKENQLYKWSGTLELAKKPYPAQGYSRVEGPEEIDPKTKKTAWRVDTVILSNVNGRQMGLLMSRWFEPGVGMVRQIFYAGDKKITKDLITYKI